MSTNETSNETSKYFDLHTQGIGYLNRIREVTPNEGTPFLSVIIAALRGSVDNAQYTHFECRVSGKKAQEIVRQLQPAVEGNSKVWLGSHSVICLPNPSPSRAETRQARPVSV